MYCSTCILFGSLRCDITFPIFSLLAAYLLISHCCLYTYIGDADFVADPSVATIVLSGNETRKCVNVTIIDDQTVERTEPFAVTITFPPNQPALRSGEIVPREMQTTGLINIIDDDGELI